MSRKVFTRKMVFYKNASVLPALLGNNVAICEIFSRKVNAQANRATIRV